MLGVDAGSHRLKICRRKPVQGRSGAPSFECVEFPTDTLARDGGSPIGRLLRAWRWPVQAAAVLPLDSGSVRTLSFPDLPPREVRQAATWELQRVVPYTVEEAVIDLIPLPHARSGENGIWLAAVCRASELDEQVRRLRTQGLDPIAAELQPLPLWRLQLLLRPEMPDALVLDLGARGSRLLVISDGAPDLFRDVPVGGALLTRAIAAGAGVQEAEAERQKRTVFQEQLPLQWLEGPLRELLTEIDRSLRFVRQQRAGLPDRILACGGGAGWPALLRLLAEDLGIPVEPWEVPVEVTAAPGDDMPSPGPAFTPAAAMATWDLAPVLRGEVRGNGAH